jgi:hypothetical protein
MNNRNFTILLILSLAQSLAGQCFQKPGIVSYDVSYQRYGVAATHEKLILSVENKKWKADPSQIQAVWEYFTETGVKEKFKDHFSIGWVNSDTTGLIDNESKTWIHPPRHNQYSLTEVAPFPDFRKNRNVGFKYSSIILFGGGFGPWSGQKSKNEYELTGMKVISGDSLWFVDSRSACNDTCNYCFFIYSQNLGFVYIVYEFFNKDKMIMKNNDFDISALKGERIKE